MSRTFIKYFLSRLVFYLLTIWVTLTLTFIIPRLVPGDPITAALNMLSEAGALRGSQEVVEEYKKLFGLDKDMLNQYLSYIAQILRGNLGISITNFPSSVSTIIAIALPWTILLLSTSTIISWILGTFLGALAGWKGAEKRRFELLSIAALTLYIIPYYIVAILILWLLSYTIPLFPRETSYGTIEMSPGSILEALRKSLLPALSIVVSSLGWWFLNMRSLVASVKREDFVVMAEAKGLKERTILWRYRFRNALLPQITGLILALGHITAGALVTEIIFSYPGVGWLLYQSVLQLDYPVIQGIVILITFTVATANLIVDTIYPLFDPRIRR
jgi:peptide/nickel transport system permease protein